MNINDVREEMKRLDKISGLDTSNVPLRVSTRMTSCWGKCCFRKRRGEKKFHVTEVVFADRLLRYGNDESVLNVVRHEYAHVYMVLKTGENHGHDHLWKAAALRFGCNGQRCDNYGEVADRIGVEKGPKYTITCKGCGAKFAFRRANRFVQVLRDNPNTKRWTCGCGCSCFDLKQNY